MADSLISNGDIVIAANEPLRPGGSTDDASGDIILRSGGVERGRTTSAGVSTGCLIGPSLDDILKTGLGLASWSHDPTLATTTLAPTSQTIYSRAVPLRAGQQVSTAWFAVAVASSGTAPTGIFVGLSNATTMLAVSANLASDAAWTVTGLRSVALGSTITASAAGLYYVHFLQNGTFSVTQPTLNRAANPGASIGSNFLFATAGTGQTALPAANAAVTLASSGSPAPIWAGLS